MTGGDEVPGLPADAAARWLRTALPLDDPGASWAASVISGGLSNITYRIQWGAHRLVLRRPPLGPALPRAHDMHREYRVLTALHPTPVPVPEPLAFCSDSGVIGAPFYVMREVPGTVLHCADDTARLPIGQRAALSERLIDVLAELHAVDVDGTGLSDLGRRSGYAGRQLKTWGGQWRRSKTRDLPDMDRLLAGLGAVVPDSAETTVVHGDFRFDNTIVAAGAVPRIAAVLDWELSTLGDPVADLATMLTYWHDIGDDERGLISVAAGLTALPGFLTTAELADRYATRTGRDLSALKFHLALAAMKLGVILEGVHARYLSSKTVGGGYDTVGTAVPVLAARGLRLLARIPPPSTPAGQPATE